MFKFVETYQYRRRLKKAREEAQLMFDYADRKRTNQGWDKFRRIDDFFTEREQRVWNEITSEEWMLSKLLGETPEWGSAKFLSDALGDSSAPGLMTVRENRSTKISYEYVELVDLMVKTINGKWSSTKWDWSDVEMFKKQGWGRPADFNDYLKRFHDAKTEEETQAVLNEYREKYPNAIY